MQGDINLVGVWTLYVKEVRRFLKVYHQTLLAPVVTTLLFLAVFSLAMGNHVETVAGVPFAEFMASGLIIMTVVQNAFANSSSSLIMGKVMGTIVDLLMPPLTAAEVVFAMAMGGVTRGVCVGILAALAIWLFVPLSVAHPLTALFFLAASSLMLALLGVIAGILAETFDHMAAITSYVITPLAFLSGTFYSIERLPVFWHAVSRANPFFYMIDGFRYGMTGHADGSVALGVGVLAAANLALAFTAYSMFRTGYRLRA